MSVYDFIYGYCILIGNKFILYLFLKHMSYLTGCPLNKIKPWPHIVVVHIHVICILYLYVRQQCILIYGLIKLAYIHSWYIPVIFMHSRRNLEQGKGKGVERECEKESKREIRQEKEKEWERKKEGVYDYICNNYNILSTIIVCNINFFRIDSKQ